MKSLLRIALAGFVIGFASTFLLFPKPETGNSITRVIPVALPTMLPSVTPTPSPIPERGFCLTVPVLMYHHVQPMAEAQAAGHAGLTIDAATFEGQMRYLADRGYRTITAEELVDSLRSNTPIAGKPIVLTADDGYDDMFTYAFPIMRKYNMVLNLFIPTGLVENAGYLTWNQITEMTASGLVTAYDHTWSHFAMPRGDAEKERTEIMTSKTQLEDHLGKTVRIFAYPWGSSNTNTVTILRETGFTGAFGTVPSFRQCDSYIYHLHRNRIGNAPLSSYGLY